jgi:drug/metabolite transporter (DMT)-like permease
MNDMGVSGRPHGYGRDLGVISLQVVTTIIAAFGWVFSIETLHGMPPLLFIGVRFLLAGLVLLPASWAVLRRMPNRNRIRAIVTGILLGLSMIAWVEGLHHTDNVGVGAFVSALGNLLAPLVGFALFRWRVGLATGAAVALATVGMAFLSLARGFSLSLGDLFFLGSALASSLNINLCTRFTATIPVLPLTAVQLLVTGVLGLAFSGAAETLPPLPGWETYAWLAASVLIATSLRFFLQVKAQSLAPVSQTALLLTLEPVWTVFVAVFWLGQTMNLNQTIGCLLIFLSLIVNRLDLIVPGLRRARP